MKLTAYVPSAKFVVGTLIVLVATTFALRNIPQLAGVRSYLGLSTA
jgi:hypothetical protein